MATNISLKNQLKEHAEVNVQETLFKNLINSDDVKLEFAKVLKDEADHYRNSIINLVSRDKELSECEPRTVIDACLTAAASGLAMDKDLEYVSLVPNKKKANLALLYKGYIQLLLRTGEYKAINVIEVFEGQLKFWNPLEEEFDIDVNSKKSDAVIGYAGYFQMLNGFRKQVFWSRENMDGFMENNFKRDPRWKSDYKAMAKRTVIRNMLSKWGSLSTEMQKIYLEDLKTDIRINGQ